MARASQGLQMRRFGWMCAFLLGISIALWADDAATPATATTPAPTAASAPLTPQVLPLVPPIIWSKPTEMDMPIVPVRSVGSLELLNSGQVGPWDMLPFDTSGLAGALGAGSIKKTRSTGEMLYLTTTTTGEMLNFAGRTFVRSTDPKTGVKVVELADTTFRTPFAMGAEAAPLVFPRVYRLAGTEPRLLHSVLEEIGIWAGYPVGVLGWVKMPEVHGLALKRAPIDNEPLTGAKRDDYVEQLKATDANVVFFAIVIPGVLPHPSVNAYLLSKAAIDFDEDSGNTSTTLIHVHGALVAEDVPGDYTSSPMILNRLRKVTVKDIMHVEGTSSVTAGTLMVYRLNFLAK